MRHQDKIISFSHKSKQSKYKKNQILMPLFKCIEWNYFAADLTQNWYMIRLLKRPLGMRRLFFNVTRFPSLIGSVLRTSMRHHWHTFFFLASPREFHWWRFQFPMYPMCVYMGGASQRSKSRSRALKVEPLVRKERRLLELQQRIQKMGAALLPSMNKVKPLDSKTQHRNIIN